MIDRKAEALLIVPGAGFGMNSETPSAPSNYSVVAAPLRGSGDVLFPCQFLQSKNQLTPFGRGSSTTSTSTCSFRPRCGSVPISRSSRSFSSSISVSYSGVSSSRASCRCSGSSRSSSSGTVSRYVSTGIEASGSPSTAEA